MPEGEARRPLEAFTSPVVVETLCPDPGSPPLRAPREFWWPNGLGREPTSLGPNQSSATASPRLGPPTLAGLARTRLGAIGQAAATALSEPQQTIMDKASKDLVFHSQWRSCSSCMRQVPRQ